MATKRTSKPSPQDLFDSLVKNAIDFLQKSIDELKSDPKASLINFQASIELFIKARLMLEHWSLIIEDPKKANIKKFLLGDFKSVTMEEALKRLREIVSTNVRRVGNNCFKVLKDHRNRLIHFFDSAYIKPDKKAIQLVVIEQCRAWYFLHQTITRDWGSEFSNHLSQIDNLHKQMMKQKEYLQAKYEEILPDIEKGKSRGAIFSDCVICSFEASLEKVIMGPLISESCLVCGFTSEELKVPCPDCGGPIYLFQGAEKGECECGAEVSISELIDKYIGHLTKDDLFDPPNAYCCECEYPADPSVVEIESGIYLCLNCYTQYDADDIASCDWCGNKCAGDLEESMRRGCAVCFGHGGY